MHKSKPHKDLPEDDDDAAMAAAKNMLLQEMQEDEDPRTYLIMRGCGIVV